MRRKLIKLRRIFYYALSDQASLRKALFNDKKQIYDTEGTFPSCKFNYGDCHRGDERHSVTNIDKAKTALGYMPSQKIIMR